MKEKKGSKTRTGIFVSLAIIFVIIIIFSVNRKKQFFNPTFQISGIFKDVGGLQIGNNVRFAGINVGIISDIQIASDSTVKVDLLINESSRRFIKKNAKANIGSDGLMGNTILLITPGEPGGKIIENNDYIVTAIPVNIDDILLKLKMTSENAAVISNHLSILMESIRSGKSTVGKLFMDSVFAENLDKTIVNLKNGAGGFKTNMQAAQHSFLLKGLFKDKKTRKEKREERRKSRKEKKK